MEDWTELRVARKWPVAVDIVALELVSKTGAELPPFEPGAYIDVQIPGGLLRPYSLCNAPHQPNHYRIAVQRERDSRGASKWLHDRLQPGDALQVRRPLNDFPLDRSAVYSVLLAGGIGDQAFTWSPSSGTWASQRSPQERSRDTEFTDTKKQLRNVASRLVIAPCIKKL